MARIPDAEVERIKSEISLVRLVESAGVTLAKQGKDLVGRCPFHSPDHTPSLIVSPDKNLWHCLEGLEGYGDTILYTLIILPQDSHDAFGKNRRSWHPTSCDSARQSARADLL